MKPFKQLSEQDIAEIVKMRALGYHQKEIAERVGCSGTNVSYHLTMINRKLHGDANEDEGMFLTFVATLLGVNVSKLYDLKWKAKQGLD